MSSLPQRLRLAEEDFLAALNEGGMALSAFDEQWELLIKDIDTAMVSSILDADTVALAHATAFRIATLADTCAELVDRNNSFTTQLMDEVNALMADLSIEPPHLPQPSSLSFALPLPTSTPTTTPTSAPIPKPSTRKRRRSDTPPEPHNGRQLKRQRSSSCLPPGQDEELKSPISNPEHAHACSLSAETYVMSASRLHQGSVDLPSTRASRKRRRVSETDITSPSPPMKRAYVGPRLHAVSDSYVSSAIASTPSQQIGRMELSLDTTVPLFVQPLIEPSVLGDRWQTSTSPVHCEKVSSPRSLTELSDLDTFLRSLVDSEPWLPGVSHETFGLPSTSLPALDRLTSIPTGSTSSVSSASSSPSPANSCPATPPSGATLDFASPPYCFPLVSPCNSHGDGTHSSMLDCAGGRVCEKSSCELLPAFANACASLDPFDPLTWLSAPYAGLSGDLSLELEAQSETGIFSVSIPLPNCVLSV